MATAGGLVLAAAGLCALVAGTYRIAEATLSPWSPAWLKPGVSAPVRLPAARRAWGEIRSRFPGTNRKVPA